MDFTLNTSDTGSISTIALIFITGWSVGQVVTCNALLTYRGVMRQASKFCGAGTIFAYTYVNRAPLIFIFVESSTASNTAGITVTSALLPDCPDTVFTFALIWCTLIRLCQVIAVKTRVATVCSVDGAIPRRVTVAIDTVANMDTEFNLKLFQLLSLVSVKSILLKLSKSEIFRVTRVTVTVSYQPFV